MDNPVDHSLDLGLVNYTQHPSNTNYIVYRFSDKNRASSFEQELNNHNIWFEKGKSKTQNNIYTLYAIHKKNYKKTEKINFLIEAKYKKPLIPFKILRYFILFFGLSILTLATIGYCKSKEKIKINQVL